MTRVLGIKGGEQISRSPPLLRDRNDVYIYNYLALQISVIGISLLLSFKTILIFMLALVVMSGRRCIHSDDSVLAWLLWLVIIWSAANAICCCASAAGTSNDVNIIRCIEREKLALVQFKQGLVDDSDALASWESKEDCCEWRGIACDNQTGHVIKLDFSTIFPENNGTSLTGQVGPSLLELPYLNYLDLTSNSFHGKIPEFIGSLSRLKELRLGSNKFSGSIPPQIGSLSNLRTLDLSNNSLTCENLEWLSHLSSLRYLNMSYLDLSKVVNWSQPISQLSSLIELQLSSCNLPDVDIQSLSFLNSSTSSSLEVVDLSFNKILNSSIFCWIVSLSSSLVHIDLFSNDIEGPIPDVFKNMVSLAYLDLSFNQLEGGIPNSFQSLCKLETLHLSLNKFADRLEDLVEILSCAQDTLEDLDLSDNSFWGSFPDDLTRFSSLTRLYLQRNKLSGSLPKSFQSLSQLKDLSLAYNQFSGSFPDVTGLSSLTTLSLSNNKLNGSLPETVGQLTSLEMFLLDSNNLSGVVTAAHLSNISRLQYLDTSFNSLLYFNLSSFWNPPFQLRFLGMAYCKVGPAFPKWIQNQRNLQFLCMSNAGISDSTPNKFWDLFSTLISLDLSMNQIHGELPNLSSKNCTLRTIDLSSNRMSGSLSPWPLPPMTYVLLSRNMFSGVLSSSLCAAAAQGLFILDLSENRLSGELPNCWNKVQLLLTLNLAKNNFSGKIPSSFGYLRSILLLQLHDNNFSGELPSLENSRDLTLLDVGSNKLSGNIPEWVGQRLTHLTVLRIRSNEFYGSIPSSLCSLLAIHVLDLSQNNISGLLPHCLSNITRFSSEVEDFGIGWGAVIQLMWKGVEREFGGNIEFLRSIDISSNYLTGDIPEALTSMLEMTSLNLSGNNLTGVIPRNFGQLKELEFLDLSRNQLSGGIPASFSSLYAIAVLNLSFNNLSGRIPRSTQLDTFNGSSFTGNVGLCGPPLTRLCPGDGTIEDPTVTSETEQDNDGLITSGFYVSIGIGFFTGFVGVCLTSLRKTSWKIRQGLRHR